MKVVCEPHTKGASEIVLAACDKVINSNGDIVPLDEESINLLKVTIDQFANEALRTLCIAYMELEGIVGIKDPVRPGVKESVALCRSAGITVRMEIIINTAKAIARECGILTDDGIAIEGPDFREKSLEELLQLVPKIQVMARSSPLDKTYTGETFANDLW
ncbi:LOW QUALITY PROTEIN: calcium-transporting ATPase 1 chloroplastic-like [Populus alba x Populus x berolinensis]|nr:LOW QUALITY PROTEIN: calcium-transporting ATPase 1 chloroplastic-like [Populus alba x Populus x berolinensis]